MKKLGLQLYTVRNTMDTAENIRETFRRIKAMGYDEAQTAGCAVSYEQFGQIAKDEGITIIGTHEGWNQVYDAPVEQVVENHKALGTTNVGIGAYYFHSEEEIYTFCAQANELGARLKPFGMKFTYHNHSFEFRRWGNDGKTAMDILAERLDPETVSFVLDTYWVQHGGGDVIDWMKRLAGRIDILHMKDMAMADTQFFTEIGSGNINFDGIMKTAAEIGVQHYVVEQDSCPGDPFDSLAASYAYIQENYMKERK